MEEENQPQNQAEEEKQSDMQVISSQPFHASEALPLDWTQMGATEDDALPIRYPHDVDEALNETDEDICIVGTAGEKITVLGNTFSSKCNPNLESLVLRSHLIKKMQGLEKFTKLNLLELYDNMVEALECLEGPGPSLRVLDMSYNSIRDMSPVKLCPNLQELYLANNKLKTIEGLSELKQLRKLDLGANRIRIMEEKELSGLVNLEELWIGKNKIETIGGLEKLTKLRRLDIQSNRLTKIENLTTQQETLEELFLAHNGIDDEGCTWLAQTSFPNLNVLDLSKNRLTSTAQFSHLEGLEELWLSSNQIETFDAIIPLKEAPNLRIETIYLEYNPIASEFEYRKRLAEWVPSLTQIDATLIGGLGAQGLSHHQVATALPIQEQMRRLQEAAIQRAKQETEAATRQQQSQF